MKCKCCPQLNSSRRRHLWFGLLIVAVPVVVALWFRQATEPYREAEKIHVLIMTLTNRRPENVTAKQWQSAVEWTNNLHCNGLVWDFKNGPAIRALRLSFERKLESPVTMEAITWLWDQYAMLCPLGARYQQWRKVMLDEIDSAASNQGMAMP